MALRTYQQVYVYIIPIITNLGFINIVVVAVRLHWFTRRMKKNGRHPWDWPSWFVRDSSGLTAVSFLYTLFQLWRRRVP